MMENRTLVAVSSLLLVIALLAGIGHLLISVDFLSYSLANILLYEHLMVGGSNLALFYPYGLCEIEYKVNQVQDRGLPREGSAYLDGLWRFTLGERETALLSLNRAVESEQSLVDAAFALGSVLLLSGDEQKAYNTWSQYQGSDRLLLLGRRCIADAKLEIAADYYLAALNSVSQSDLDTYRELILFFSKTSNQVAYQRAWEGFSAISERGSLDFNQTMGKVYLFQGELAKARWLLESVTEQTPGDAESWYWAGIASYKSEKYEQARDFFRKSIEIAPDQSDSYIYLGQTFAAEGDYLQAIEWYESALKIAPRDGWLFGNLAQAKMLQGRYQEAFDLALRGIEVDPRDHLPAIAARAAMKLFDWPQARDLMEKAVTLDPENLNNSLKLAEICIELEDFRCAKIAFQNVLRIDPDNSSARQGLSAIGEIQP
jgi:tetratricopeptide (TPR) repeat protein